MEVSWKIHEVSWKIHGILMGFYANVIHISREFPGEIDGHYHGIFMEEYEKLVYFFMVCHEFSW